MSTRLHRQKARTAAPAGARPDRRAACTPATGSPAARVAPARPRTEWLLIRGDAKTSTHALREEQFDLIYADPPFFTGRRHGNGGHDGFDDRWSGGIDAYLDWLVPALAQMRRLLAPTGSLFVHLDWHAAHAVKVALDRVFGRQQFINEIIWSYRTGGASGRWLARKHDTLLFYARSDAYKFRRLAERSYLAHRYGFSNVRIEEDDRGPYRWALMRDVWEIPALRGNMPERVDFPTQKPLALLRRIVSLVTDPGDLVGDFFCGSGTTLVAAVAAGRRAIGMDISPTALAIAAQRLQAPLPGAGRDEEGADHRAFWEANGPGPSRPGQIRPRTALRALGRP